MTVINKNIILMDRYKMQFLHQSHDGSIHHLIAICLPTKNVCLSYLWFIFMTTNCNFNIFTHFQKHITDV